MSQKNIEFLKNNYRIRPSVNIFKLPIWGSSERPVFQKKNAFSERYQGKCVCVFGGQLTAGRGLDMIIDLAEKVRADGLDVHFVVAGDGPQREWFVEKIKSAGLSNIEYLGTLSRTEYYDLLSASSIGLVLNTVETSVPTFPSKSIDYFRMSLPILAGVESSTDYIDFIENETRSGLACPAFDRDQLYRNLVALAEDPERRKAMGLNGNKYYHFNMTVERIASRIIQDSGLQKNFSTVAALAD